MINEFMKSAHNEMYLMKITTRTKENIVLMMFHFLKSAYICLLFFHLNYLIREKKNHLPQQQVLC